MSVNLIQLQVQQHQWEGSAHCINIVMETEIKLGKYVLVIYEIIISRAS